MSAGTHPLREATCLVCCQIFTSHSNRVKYCPSCKRFIENVRTLMSKNHVVMSETDIVIEAKIRRERAMRKRDCKMTLVGKCLYCGKETTVNKRSFCSSCVTRGYDGVYEVTGPRKTYTLNPVEIVDGWRGRPVAGFRAVDRVNHN